MQSGMPEPTAASRPPSVDLNARQETPRIHYSAPGIIGATVFGFVALADAGFLGYPGDPPYTRLLFGHTWPLFAWFCSLIVAFQASLLLGLPRWRGSLRHVYTVAAISMVVVASSVIYGPEQITRALPPVVAAIASGLYVLLGLYLLVHLLASRTVGPLGRSLSVAWPGLTLFAILGAYLAASFTGAYLHLQGTSQQALPLGLLYAGLALISGSIVLLFTVVSAALLVAASSNPEDMNSLLGTAIGLVTDLLPTLAQILFLVLACFNALLLVTGISGRTPFFQPSAGAVIGLLGALLASAIKVARNRRRTQASAGDA